jgi:hypothetical protein
MNTIKHVAIAAGTVCVVLLVLNKVAPTTFGLTGS